MKAHSTSGRVVVDPRKGHHPRWIRRGGAALLLVTAVCHLVAFPDHYQVTAYVGLSFLLYAAAATVIAIAVERDARAGYPLGALLSGSAFALYIAARTVGLPSFSDDSWVDPIGVVPVGLASFILEALFVALYVGGFLHRGARLPVRRASRQALPHVRLEAALGASSRLAPATTAPATRRTP